MSHDPNHSPRNHWPDPSRPGFPPHPERNSVHALLVIAQAGPPEIAKWSASTCEWLLPGASLSKSAGWAANFCRYLSPLFNGEDMRAAYEKGVKEGYKAAAAQMAEDKERVFHDAMQACESALAQARCDGAKDMQIRAAQVAMASDSILANQLRSFDDIASGAIWHRRVRMEAILALPLLSDPAPNTAPSASIAVTVDETELSAEGVD